MPKQPAQRASAAHTVPLVTQAASGERKRIARFAWFSDGLVDGVGKLGFAVCSGKNTIFIQTSFACAFARFQWPLLRRRVEHGVAHAGDVQIVAAGGFAVLVPDGFYALGFICQ